MDKIIGTHVFEAGCQPVKADGRLSGYHTFTISIYPWVARSSGRGVKRGPAVVRVNAYSVDHKMAFERAADIVRQLDAGNYAGPKKVNLKNGARAG
jgi:hypothetical protein